ncbi:hypothetical protein PPACK8108_LOCUS5149 [Phakopsora pachyrhizi]|uniref:Uncharacterized protein n=1 Tax=Phakopsora pachyrhizi TaxID=170000 RepID=A0AAV0AR03_PHAPC|nr:hypothetical protein PPACK8108_LOCUS5149 [Phakopsora pachyrhizi]
MQLPSEIPYHSNHSSAHQQHHVWNHSNFRQSSVVSAQRVSPASTRPIRSPSPFSPLPAIHVDEGQRIESVLLNGDEGASAFFRRLKWSVDGLKLLTPAGRISSKGKAREDDKNNNSEAKRNQKKKVHLGIDSTKESTNLNQPKNNVIRDFWSDQIFKLLVNRILTASLRVQDLLGIRDRNRKNHRHQHLWSRFDLRTIPIPLNLSSNGPHVRSINFEHGSFFLPSTIKTNQSIVILFLGDQGSIQKTSDWPEESENNNNE